jgi:hypothetical protein
MSYAVPIIKGLEKRVEALKAENAALREFVAAVDAENDCLDGKGFWECTARYDDAVAARQRLATDYGIWLPGQEGEG